MFNLKREAAMLALGTQEKLNVGALARPDVLDQLGLGNVEDIFSDISCNVPQLRMLLHEPVQSGSATPEQLRRSANEAPGFPQCFLDLRNGQPVPVAMLGLVSLAFLRT